MAKNKPGTYKEGTTSDPKAEVKPAAPKAEKKPEAKKQKVMQTRLITKKNLQKFLNDGWKETGKNLGSMIYVGRTITK